MERRGQKEEEAKAVEKQRMRKSKKQEPFRSRKAGRAGKQAK